MDRRENILSEEDHKENSSSSDKSTGNDQLTDMIVNLLQYYFISDDYLLPEY
jgi:hypothetical protein